MKLQGKISIFIGADSTRIEIEDDLASTTFATITLTPQQLSEALSRIACVDCEINIQGLERIGKKHEHRTFSFPIPEKYYSSSHSVYLTELSQSLLDGEGEGWITDGYFSSQSSFYKDKEGNCFARVTVRRWI